MKPNTAHPTFDTILATCKQFLASTHLSLTSRKLYLADIKRFLHWLQASKTLSESKGSPLDILTQPSNYTSYMESLRNNGADKSVLLRALASLKQLGTVLSATYSIANPTDGFTLKQRSDLSEDRIFAENYIKPFTNQLESEHLSPLTVRSYKSDVTRYLHWASSNTPSTQMDAVLGTKNREKYLDHLRQIDGMSSATIERKGKSIARFATWYAGAYPHAVLPDSPSARLASGIGRISPIGRMGLIPATTTAPGAAEEIVKKNNSRKRFFLPIPRLFGPGSELLGVRNLLPFAILLLFTITLGVFSYRQFSRDRVVLTEAYPSTPVTPNRQISFQGRLENAGGTPITSATNFVFKLFDAASAGTQLYSSGTCSVTPDSDGVFNTQIGSTCGSAITSDVFTQNANVYLEVTVGAETLTPRQQIATVAYALNSETLQGFPISATVSAVRNTVVPMNQWGEILVGEQNPRMTGVSGTFQISAPALSLATTTGSSGNITIAPDGTGQVNVNGNTTTTNFFNVADAQLSTGTLITGTVGNNTTGFKLLDLLSGTSPTSKFSVDASGNTTLAGTLSLPNSNTLTGVTNYIEASGGLAVGSGTTYKLTSTGDLYANNIYTGGTQRLDSAGNLTNIGTTQLHGVTYTWPSADAGSSGYVLSSNAGGTLSWVAQTGGGGSTYWRLATGALSPVNDTLDLLLGGNATGSAKIGLINVNSGTPTATIAGTTANVATYLNGNGTLGTTNAQTLTLGSISTGNVILAPGGTTALTAAGANLTAAGTLTLPSTNTLTGVTNYLQLSQGLSVGGGTTYYIAGNGNGNLNGLTLGAALALPNTNSLTGVSGYVQFNNGISVGAATAYHFDNTGNLVAQGVSGTSLTDSGLTPGSIVFAGMAGLLSQNNGNFYWDNTNKHLGVGASGTNLLGTLDLRSTLGTLPVATISGATSMASLMVDQSGVGDLLTASKSGATKFVVANNGNVGIGTANPSYLLDVNGNARIVGATFTNNVYFANSSDTTGYYVDVNGNAKFLDLIAADTGNPGLTVGNGSIGFAKIGGSTISDNAGNLTLASDTGTTDITGNATTTGYVTVGNGIINSGVADGTSALGFTLNTNNTLTGADAKLLSIKNNGTEKMYLDASGNLYVSGTITSGAGFSVTAVNKSGGTVAKKALVVLDPTNANAFTTTTTPYSKGVFGVVQGVEVNSDANNNGACDANETCLIAVGGEVDVTIKNTTTVAKGDYLFTSDTAGSAVSSAKQYDGLVGVVSDTTNAGSGSVKMIFKVQPQVTASAAIDKTSKHNEYWLYANDYSAVNEGSSANANLLARGITFDNFYDNTKTDSANTTVSGPAPVGGTAAPYRAGLMGGQTMSAATTDNAGNTYLGSSTVNKVFYYDRTKDSIPQVQVELGIDPNWYNGVTLAVATTSAQFSQNSTVPKNNPNLSTSYNGSLIKVTGTYASNAKTIYITIASPTTFNWTDYNGQAATAVTITPGVAQALGTTGVSATFTATSYNVGDVFKIASWFVEPSSATRGAKQQFPERSNIVATASSVDIIDADTQKLWMRFNNSANANDLMRINGSASISVLNGKVYSGISAATNSGLAIADFPADTGEIYTTGGYSRYASGISQRNASLGFITINGTAIVNQYVNDVSAAVIPNQPTQQVTVSGWGYIQGAGTYYAYENVNLPYKFNQNPIITVSEVGYKDTTAPASPDQCAQWGDAFATTGSTSTTSFSVILETDTHTNFANTRWLCYTWTATGVVSPKQFVATATGTTGTDGGTTIINETDRTAVNVTVGSQHADVIWSSKVALTTNGNLYTVQNDDTSGANYVAVYYNAAAMPSDTSINQQINGYYRVGGVSDWNGLTTGPVINGTNASNKITSLSVTQGTSTVDGSSNTIYVGTDKGVSVIQEQQSHVGDYQYKGGNENSGSVKYYTKDYVSEEMVGDIRGMWPLSASGALSMSDVSVKGNTLTNTGSVTAVSGVRGMGATFNGSNYLSIADNSSLNLSGGSTMSVGAWFKTTSSGTVIAKTQGGVSYPDFYLVVGAISSGKITFTMSVTAGTSQVAVTSNTTVNDGNWHYAIGSYDGANMNLYIDGKLDNTAARTGAVYHNASASLAIGAVLGTPNSSFLTGSVDEPFVTATALSASQIKHMYEVGARALQSHATTLGGGGADLNQELGGSVNTVGDARPDYNNQYM